MSNISYVEARSYLEMHGCTTLACSFLYLNKNMSYELALRAGNDQCGQAVIWYSHSQETHTISYAINESNNLCTIMLTLVMYIYIS